MQKPTSKNKLICFLLFHGVVINFLICPFFVLYTLYTKHQYLSIDEWSKSICINLFTWYFLYYAFSQEQKNELNLKSEFKKYYLLVHLHTAFLRFFSKQKFRRITMNALIWCVIIFNIISPIFLGIILDLELNLTYGCIWFIIFQFVYFVFYYIAYYYPEDENQLLHRYSTPWLIDFLFLNTSGAKTV